MSDSQPGEAVGKAFPHLAAVYADTKFKSQDEVERLLAELPQSAVFGAAPHGVSHALIDSLLKRAEAARHEAARRRTSRRTIVSARRKRTRLRTSTLTALRRRMREVKKDRFAPNFSA